MNRDEFINELAKCENVQLSDDCNSFEYRFSVDTPNYGCVNMNQLAVINDVNCTFRLSDDIHIGEFSCTFDIVLDSIQMCEKFKEVIKFISDHLKIQDSYVYVELDRVCLQVSHNTDCYIYINFTSTHNTTIISNSEYYYSVVYIPVSFVREDNTDLWKLINSNINVFKQHNDKNDLEEYLKSDTFKRISKIEQILNND